MTQDGRYDTSLQAKLEKLEAQCTALQIAVFTALEYLPAAAREKLEIVALRARKLGLGADFTDAQMHELRNVLLHVGAPRRRAGS